MTPSTSSGSSGRLTSYSSSRSSADLTQPLSILGSMIYACEPHHEPQLSESYLESRDGLKKRKEAILDEIAGCESCKCQSRGSPQKHETTTYSEQPERTFR